VLLRADYNVPLTKDGKVDDDYRLTQSLPTLQYLLERGCKLIICSHLGRPDGKIMPELSLEPVAARLGELLGRNVQFVPESIGDRVVQASKQLGAGQVILLENLRFHAQEEANDPAFARKLAADSGARYFVQDGFGVVHRAHASTVAITQYLPSVSGLLLEREYQQIEGAMANPKRPLVAALGGAKISDKIKLVERFVQLADRIIIGGAMANTFLAEKGVKIGRSVYEDDMADTIKQIYAAIDSKVGPGQRDAFLTLPVDAAVATDTSAQGERREVTLDQVGAEDMILDIGPRTIELMTQQLQNAGTVIWNGTLGYAELPQFAHGSARLALELAQHPQITSIIGGGDTADFVLKWDSRKGGSFTHVSTGGGASLDLMAGDKLPGIEALMDA